MAAATLFFAMSLGQLLPRSSASAGFYLLARSMASIQAIAAGPHRDEALAHRVARWAVDGVALLFPRLDSVTRTEWLLYGSPPAGAYLGALSADSSCTRRCSSSRACSTFIGAAHERELRPVSAVPFWVCALARGQRSDCSSHGVPRGTATHGRGELPPAAAP